MTSKRFTREAAVPQKEKTMEKNLCAKTRPIEDPYEIWQTPDGSWEWRVLKKYQRPELEAKNEYARWFCAVKSPFTYDDYEMGDVYVKDIKVFAAIVEQVQ